MVQERIVDGVVILSVTTAIFSSEANGEALRNRIAELLQQGQRSFLLDMSMCPLMVSKNAGLLVEIYKMVNQQGGCLNLLYGDRKLKEILNRLGFDTFLTNYDDEYVAVRDTKIAAT